jgi:hypothetical protein
MKRIFLTFIFSTSILAIMVTSCARGLPYWELKGVNIFHRSSLYNSSTGPSINTSDSLVLAIECGLDYLAIENTSLNSWNNPFISSSFATQPPLHGYEGSRDPIRKVKVYSDNMIGSYMPNMDLSPIITTWNEGSSRLYTGLSPEMINDEFTKGTRGGGYIELTVTDRPNNANTKHVFTIELETRSGKMYTAQTDTITWN